MSVTFCWDLVRTDHARFEHGTSIDTNALGSVADRDGVVTTGSIDTLWAMHAATHCKESLWSDIANLLQKLQGDDPSKKVSIKVWPEY